jgi:hypothetical protein
VSLLYYLQISLAEGVTRTADLSKSDYHVQPNSVYLKCFCKFGEEKGERWKSFPAVVERLIPCVPGYHNCRMSVTQR